MLVDPCENVTGASQVAQNVFISVSGNAPRSKQFRPLHTIMFLLQGRYEKLYLTIVMKNFSKHYIPVVKT